jgi:hypothetical protein
MNKFDLFIALFFSFVAEIGRNEVFFLLSLSCLARAIKASHVNLSAVFAQSTGLFYNMLVHCVSLRLIVIALLDFEIYEKYIELHV